MAKSTNTKKTRKKAQSKRGKTLAGPSRKAAPVAGASADLAAERTAWLESLFPEAVTEGKIDFDRLRESLGYVAEGAAERYSFTWAGRRDSVRLLQTPSRAALVPAADESLDFGSSRNLYLEGDNLEALKLLYKAYFGRIKMIYIDPPYNTGGDFVYPDNYSDPLDTYLRLTGQKDANGLLTSNLETSGRFHSAWLSMMYPRLFLARQLLHESGSIWISIDDAEVANLKLICNEVFGEENWVATFIWEKRTTRENRRVFSFNHDYILCYAKDKEKFQAARNLLPLSEQVLKRYGNPDRDPRGDWQSVSLNAQAGHATPAQFYTIQTPSGRKVPAPSGRAWSVTEDRMKELIADNRVWFGSDGNNIPRLKVFLSEAREGLTPHTLWKASEVGTNDSAKKALIELFDGVAVYETPKPVELIKRIVQIATSGDDIVLDFFAGTCTTAHATMELNRADGGARQFIMADLPHPTAERSEAGKAGYRTIAEIGRERVRRAAQRSQHEREERPTLESRDTPEDLGFRVFKMTKSNFRGWERPEGSDTEEYAKQLEMLGEGLVEGWDPTNVMWEVAVKEGFSLASRVEEVTDAKANSVLRVIDSDRDQSFFICLDDVIEPATLKELELSTDDLLVCRDSAIDDTMAANLALQCRLKTI